jgi:hypothetical protein
LQPQDWEGDQQPHTLSVLEMNRGGFRYWAWYGLNNGRGVGLARSNDLVHWTKYEKNPLWLNARWPSVLKGADPAHPDTLYFAITRDYDTPASRIVLASSEDGLQLTEIKNLVQPVQQERNQNPNLFRDPVSGRFFLTWYRGNDNDYFDIASRSADTVAALDRAPEKLLLHTVETVAAPTLMYLPGARGDAKGIYYLATEVYPNRYDDAHRGDWQVKVFYSAARRRRVRAGRQQSGGNRRARLPVPAHIRRHFLRLPVPSRSRDRESGRWKSWSRRCQIDQEQESGLKFLQTRGEPR